MNAAKSSSELRWVLAWAVAIVVLSSIPYLWGICVTPEGHRFLGLTHNIDDGAVYLSWMRQVTDGRLTFSNLFTTEPTTARQFNLLILLMGWFARLTGLQLVTAFHVFRIALGIALIVAVWEFSKLFLESENERRLLIPLVGLSAGIGWLMPGHGAPTGPVDNWQPEAITFLSIYLNPLFLAGLILMIGSFYWLALAHRTGRAANAVWAGLCLLLVGNIHTYDVITVACIWTAYLIVLAVAERRFPTRTVLLSLLAALIAVPSVAYQYHLFQVDAIYRARANSPAPSPSIYSFLAGHGLVLMGAVAAMALVLPRRDSKLQIPSSKFLIVWSVMGFVLPYIPVAQQRKLVMGLHIPLCILCAYALSRLLPSPHRRGAGGEVARGLLLAFILFTTGSNAGFLSDDVNLLSIGRTATHYSPYMSTDELNAMRFIRRDRKIGHSVFAPPTFALFTPAFTGHKVCYGHWSETPDYGAKLREWMDLELGVGNWGLGIAAATYYVSVSGNMRPPARLIGRSVFRVHRSGEVEVWRLERRRGLRR